MSDADIENPSQVVWSYHDVRSTASWAVQEGERSTLKDSQEIVVVHPMPGEVRLNSLIPKQAIDVYLDSITNHKAIVIQIKAN